MEKLRHSKLEALRRLNNEGEAVTVHRPGFHRISISTWRSLQKSELIEEGFPYRITDKGRSYL